MTLIITATEKLPTTNTSSPVLVARCTNCIHGDYWVDRHAQAEYQVSGLKSHQNIEVKVIDDRSIAAHCPNYQLADAAN